MVVRSYWLPIWEGSEFSTCKTKLVTFVPNLAKLQGCVIHQCYKLLLFNYLIYNVQK